MMKWFATIIVIMVVAACSPLPQYAPQTLADQDGQFLTVDGIETYVIDVGPRDGQPVVLVHGFGASTFSWRYTIPALTADGYRVIAFDRPGYGLSEKRYDFDYTHVNQADHLVALLDALAIEQAAVVGHSQGANIAMHVALNHPERVNKLVIVAGAVILNEGASVQGQLALSSSPILVNLAGFEPLARLIGLGLQFYLSPDRLDTILTSAYADQPPDDALDGYLRPFYTPDWEMSLIAMIRDSIGNEIPTSQLETITQPVLLVWGKDDSWVPIANGEQLRRHLNNVTWRVYVNVGHMVMEEKPDTFNRDLLEYLGGQ